jgi:pimeloyl-ACP methyl ester carboxylesterase
VTDGTVSAQEALPDSRMELFDGAGHFPHVDDPRRFAEVRQVRDEHAARPTDRRSLRRHLQETR